MQSLFRTALNKERMIHGLKTALACLIGFTITASVKFPVDQWLIVTIIVVMCAQINVGGVLQKSYMRFLGTLSGSIIAGATLYFFGQLQHLESGITIALSVMFFSYIATRSKSFVEFGTLGAVTTVIILAAKQPSLSIALARFLEISLGILIAALVSQFVLPIHARTHLRRIQATTLKQINTFFLQTQQKINKTADKTGVADFHTLDEGIAASLNSQRLLSKEARRETMGLFNIKLFQKILACEKEILRCISFMHYAESLNESSQKFLFDHLQLNIFLAAVSESLIKMANSIDSKHFQQIFIFLPEIKDLKETITHSVQKIPIEDSLIINSFLFFCEILKDRLQELANLQNKMYIVSANEIAGKKGA